MGCYFNLACPMRPTGSACPITWFLPAVAQAWMPPMSKKSTLGARKANRYQAILVKIFSNHGGGNKGNKKDFLFERDEITTVASQLKIQLPKNIGDVLYSQRYRAEWPEAIKSAIPKGHDLVILPAGKSRYRFKLVRGSSRVIPRLDAAVIKVPDATPEIIAAYAQSDEQAVLARVRYNRLIDVFLGITAYS